MWAKGYYVTKVDNTVVIEKVMPFEQYIDLVFEENIEKIKELQ